MLGTLFGTAVGAPAGLGSGCFLCLVYAGLHSHGYPMGAAVQFAMAVTAAFALFGTLLGMYIAWNTRPQPPISN